MAVDKYYQEMIDNILNGASDREQLEIILELVKGLKDWNDKGDDYLTNLYYYNLEQIEKKIEVVLEKENCYSAYEKAISDYTKLQRLLSLYLIDNNITGDKYGALYNFIKSDDRFSITNDLGDMLDFWYNDILLTIKKVGNVGYELFGIEVYDSNNLIRTFNNIEDLVWEVEVLNNEYSD